MLLVALAKFNENSQDLPSSSGILAKHAMCPQVKYVKRKPSKPLGASMNVHTLRLQKYSLESIAEKYHRSIPLVEKPPGFISLKRRFVDVKLSFFDAGFKYTVTISPKVNEREKGPKEGSGCMAIEQKTFFSTSSV